MKRPGWFRMGADGQSGECRVTRIRRPTWALTSSEPEPGVKEYARPIAGGACLESDVEVNVSLFQRDTDPEPFVVVNDHRLTRMEAWFLTVALMEGMEFLKIERSAPGELSLAVTRPNWAASVTYPEPGVVEYVRPMGRVMCAATGVETIIRVVQRELEFGAKVNIEGLDDARMNVFELGILTTMLMSSLSMIRNENALAETSEGSQDPD